jgi:hypothetical protein
MVKKTLTETTRPTLDYYTISCKPIKGKKLKIQLASAATSQYNYTGTEVSKKIR